MSAEESFKAGLVSYQQKDFATAIELFGTATKLSPLQKEAWLNLGVSHLAAGNLGAALGAFRKTVYIDPLFFEAHRSIQFLEQKIVLPSQTRSLWQTLHESALVYIPFFGIFLFWILLSFFLATRWIRHWGLARAAKKLALEPPRATLPLWFFSLFMILFSLLVLAKGYDDRISRATVIVKDLEMRSGPSTEASALQILKEGQELLLEGEDKDWFFVTNYGGLTGWVPKPSLMKTNP